MRTVGTLICLLATLIASPTAFAQQPCPTLVVSNNNDQVNGTMSSPCALIANPGPDGISLREAIMAADNATGTGTITITFAPTLAGQTITPGSANCCYIVTRDSVAIVGLIGSNGQPAVTLNAANLYFLFSVTASNFTLKSMNINGLGAANSGPVYGLYVRAGETAAQGQTVNPGDELQVSNTVITGNVFSNTPGQATIVEAIVLGAAYPNTAPNAIFSGAVVANNTFSFTALASGTTEAVKLEAQGTNSTVENVSILNNTITNVQYGIEIVPADLSSGGRILNTRITANSFSANQQFNNGTLLLIDPSGDDGLPCTNNAVDGTAIEGNVITGVAGVAISLIGGIGNGSTVSATGNAITNTSITNNLITGDTVYGAISIQGGRQGSSGNSVSGVSIVNNTIANFSGCSSCGGAIDVDNNLSGGANNTVSGVTVLNTILWNNTPSDFSGTNAVSPSQVTTSITAQAGYAGVNRTINANPQFVSSNNFGLQSGSPARHAGTSAGAPAIDIDCQERASPPSIGAYEFQGPDICTSSPNATFTATHDFNGDNKSDILFRSTGSPSSMVAMWLMNGSSILDTGTVATLANTYSIIGQRDFNGDGKADLLWRDTSGNVYMWFMNGLTMSSSANLGNVPNTWTVLGTADMNGDGLGDLLWQDTAGDLAIWFMDGSTISSTASLGTVVLASGWSIVWETTRTILWKNTNSNPYTYSVWKVNGSSFQSAGIGSVPSNWVVQGMGDFNGDGVPDVLWRDNNSGTMAIWFLNSSGGVQSAAALGVVAGWTVAQTGDYNGDGTSDILWIDSSGDVAIWFMVAGKVSSTTGLGNVGTSWTVQALNAE